MVFDAAKARSVQERDAAFAPFGELGGEVVGEENNMSGAADEFVLFGFGLGSDERKNGATVGRRNGDPAIAGLETGVVGELETELVEEEAKAAVLVADEDIDAVEAGVGSGRGAHGGIIRSQELSRLIEYAYSQLPLTAIPATKKAPMRIIWSTATRLIANQRTPFIRKAQNAANARDSRPKESQTRLASDSE